MREDDDRCAVCGGRLYHPVCYCPHNGYIHCGCCPAYNYYLPLRGECMECEKITRDRNEVENDDEY